MTTVSVIACSAARENQPVLRHQFDEDTGANITSLSQPLVFYRNKPWLASHARDYVYLGPIEVSRAGRRNYLLWFGIWSTIDELGRPSESVRDVFQTVFLVADDEPMELQVSAWSGQELGMANSVYATPIDGASNAFYAVTRDQLRRLAQANSIMIHPNTDDPPGTEYLLRKKRHPSIADFASYLPDE